MGDDRLYTLDTLGDPHGSASLYTGRVPDGRQVLIGWDYGGLLLLWFDPQGELLEVEQWQIPCDPDWGAHGPHKDQILRLLPGRQAEMGFQPGPIQVRHFDVDDPFEIRFRGMTVAMLDFLDNPYHLTTEEDREDMTQGIAEWQAGGNFVLVWGDEGFCLTREGKQCY